MKKTNTGVNRRTVLKAGTAIGAVALASPVLVSKAMASSGELNLLDWSDYWPADMLAKFTKETGIKVNYTGYGSNEELLTKMKATNGSGADIIGPTGNKNLQWGPLNILKPWDMSRIPIKNANPAMVKIGTDNWNFGGKGSTWIPHIWGTEGIAWRTDLWLPPASDGVPSYGAVWEKANAGRTMCRVHSGMLGAGLYMETIGALTPGSVWGAYKSPENMRKAWDVISKWTIARKGNLRLVWNDADTQKNALLSGAVWVGQTWDGPPLSLKTAGDPVTYQAPKEGALAWVDGLAMPIGAKNIDQAYALIDFLYQAKNAGPPIDEQGYNSPILGASKFASPQYAKNFAEAYPGNALANLNPWPAEPAWYVTLRTEYVNKFKSA